MGADGSRRARVTLGAFLAPHLGRVQTPPRQTATRAAAGRRRRGRRFISAAASGHHRGKNAGKHFPAPPLVAGLVPGLRPCLH